MTVLKRFRQAQINSSVRTSIRAMEGGFLAICRANSLADRPNASCRANSMIQTVQPYIKLNFGNQVPQYCLARGRRYTDQLWRLLKMGSTHVLTHSRGRARAGVHCARKNLSPQSGRALATAMQASKDPWWHFLALSNRFSRCALGARSWRKHASRCTHIIRRPCLLLSG